MRLRFVVSLSVVVLTLAVFLPFFNADACTRIFWNTIGPQGPRLVARNMDLALDDSPTFYVFPAGISKNGGDDVVNPATWTSQYGSLVMTFMGASNLCDEGINTRGLAFHYLYLEGTVYETRDSRPGVNGGKYGQYLLDNAANVSEALTLMSQTQLVPGALGAQWPCHIALEDALGDSAVVEFVGGQMIVYHGAEYTVLTNEPTLDQQLANLTQYWNFGGTLPWPGDVDSVSRFVRASAFLKTLNSQPFPEPTPDLIARLFSAIRAESTPFGALERDGGEIVPAWPTLWTSILDLTNKSIYFTHNVARNNFWIDMGKLNFSPGAPVLSLNADRTDLTGEVSRLFTSPAQVSTLLLILFE
jgi:penicillin V acylase-like amidase (Ntn superfamily)